MEQPISLRVLNALLCVGKIEKFSYIISNRRINLVNFVFKSLLIIMEANNVQVTQRLLSFIAEKCHNLISLYNDV